MGKSKKERIPQSVFINEFIVDNDYIFYERLFNSKYRAKLWKQIGDKALDDLQENIDFFGEKDTKDMAADFLLRQAAIEKQKEINFLKNVFGVDATKINLDSYPVLINKLNTFIGLKDEYDNLLTALNEGIGDTEEQRKKRRGYGAAAYFDSYLGKQISLKMSAALQNKSNINIIISGSEADYNKFITNIIESSIEATIKHMAKVEGDTFNGEKIHMWKNIIRLLDKTESALYGRFKSELYKRYNLDNVKKEIRTFTTDKIRNKKNLRGIQKKIKEAYGLDELGFRKAEGYLEEFFQVVLQDDIIISDKKTEIGRRGTVIESNVAKTDTVSLYSANVDINLEPLLNDLNSAGHFENLVQAQKFFTDFNKKLQSMPENFIVYESVKKYATNSDNFRGFGGGNVNIRDLPLMFEKTQNQIDVDNLIITLLNTMTDAILSDDKEVRKEISNILSSSLATFLFDDWKSIGNIKNNNALHIFILDTLRVPLSYLLYAVGTAIKETKKNPTSLVKFNFHIGATLYPDPIGTNEDDEPFDETIGMIGYWDEQRQAAFNEANFSVTFLQNFNDLIIDLIRNLS